MCGGGGRAFWNFRMHGGGKISMPLVIGVRIFSETTQLVPTSQIKYGATDPILPQELLIRSQSQQDVRS